MEIQDRFPVILTKDAKFLARINKQKVVEGAVILLPEDAVLVKPQVEGTAPK